MYLLLHQKIPNNLKTEIRKFSKQLYRKLTIVLQIIPNLVNQLLFDAHSHYVIV